MHYFGLPVRSFRPSRPNFVLTALACRLTSLFRLSPRRLRRSLDWATESDLSGLDTMQVLRTFRQAELHLRSHSDPHRSTDVVLWDSHPLSLGAIPQQVIVDGILQLPLYHISGPDSANELLPPTPPTFSEAAVAASISPDLPSPRNLSANAVFVNISEIFLPGNINGLDHLTSSTASLSLVVKNGEIVCAGDCSLSPEDLQYSTNLQQGTILPPLISFGPALGLEVFESEPSTSDGAIPASSLQDLAKLVAGGIARAADGISFGDKHVDLARQAGVSIAVATPTSPGGFLRGLTVAFRTSAKHGQFYPALLKDEDSGSTSPGLETGAIVKEVVALHLSIARTSSGPIRLHPPLACTYAFFRPKGSRRSQPRSTPFDNSSSPHRQSRAPTTSTSPRRARSRSSSACTRRTTSRASCV